MNYKIGQKFNVLFPLGDVETYILCTPASHLIALINIKTGYRWGHPIEYDGPLDNIPASIIETLVDEDDYKNLFKLIE